MPVKLKFIGLSCSGITLPSSLPKSLTKKGTSFQFHFHFQALKRKNRAPKCLDGRITPTNQSHAHTPVAYLGMLEQLRCSIKSWKPIRKFSTGSQMAEHHPWNIFFSLQIKRMNYAHHHCSFPSLPPQGTWIRVTSFSLPLLLPLLTQRCPKFNSPQRQSQTEPIM